MPKSRGMGLKAVIFDFDGVIVDSEPLHYMAFQEVLKPLGMAFSYDEYLDRYIGFDDRDAFKEAFRIAGKELSTERLSELIKSKSVTFERIVREKIEAFPGARRLVRELYSEGVPLAIASGALKEEIILILEKLSLVSFFEIIVSADQVKKSKPHPETYMVALERLRGKLNLETLKPGHCVAIEDTPAGIKSAQNAGLKVVAVGHSYNTEDLADADHVVKSLKSVTLSSLIEVAKAH